MALTLASKAPTAEYFYTWGVPVASGDSVLSASYSLTSGTITVADLTVSANDVILFVTGGAAGEVAVLALEAVTSGGETIAETLYLPIQASTHALAPTVLDVCAFAYRKIAGIGEDPSSAALADMVERFNGLAASWAAQGADLGIPLPAVSTDSLQVADYAVDALRYNLILRLLDLYPGYDPAPTVVTFAKQGLQQIKSANLPDTREPAQYF